MSLPSRLRHVALALLASLSLCSFAARAADIYVLDAVMDRDGASSISPTFIVTPGERALLAFDGERELDVAMTLIPGAAAERFDLRVELVDGVEAYDRVIPVSLAETATVELAGRTIKVLVQVQEALDDAAASGGEGESEPAAGDQGN